MKKKIGLILGIILFLSIIGTKANATTKTETAYNWGQLKSTIENCEESNLEILLSTENETSNSNWEANSTITIPQGKNFTITAQNNITIKRGANFKAQFFINSGTLTIKTSTSNETQNLVLDGNKEKILASNRVIETRSGGNLYLNKITIQNNKISSNNGGALYNIAGSYVELNNVELRDNEHLGTATSIFGGGAIFTSGKLTINNSIISGNYAKKQGGGIYGHKASEIRINNTQIINNTANNGGGIYSQGKLIIEGEETEISHNTAEKYGGGICIGSEFAETRIYNVKIEKNKAQEKNGGAIYANGKTEIIGVNITENEAERYGGGIYVAKNGECSMKDTTISQNLAGTYKSGIYAVGKVTKQNVIEENIEPNAGNTNFSQISKYKYNINTREFEKDNQKYEIELAEDGVILIYDSNKNLVASSKEIVGEPNVFSEDEIELAASNGMSKQIYKIEVNGEHIKIGLYNNNSQVYDPVAERALTKYMSKEDEAIELEYGNVKFTMKVVTDAKLLVTITREEQNPKEIYLYNWDYISHMGIILKPDTESTDEAVPVPTDSEEEKYIKYTKHENYRGTDITKYNAELYQNYIENFKEIVYEIAEHTTFLLDKKIKDESAGATEHSKKTVTLEKGQYLVNCDYSSMYFTSNDKMGGASTEGGFGIVVPSYTTLDLNGAVLKQINDDKNNSNIQNVYNNYRILRIETGKDITIKNGILVGDRAERTEAAGLEKGVGVYFATTKGEENEEVTINNVEISNMVLKYLGGDGVELNKPSGYTNDILTSENVIIKDNYIYCCCRQGISVVNSNGVTIDGNHIYNIIGTDPQYCIDIEPEVNQHKSYNCNENCSTSNTDNIVISNNILDNFRSIICMYNAQDLALINNDFYGVAKLYNSDGKIEIKNNRFYKNNYSTIEPSSIKSIFAVGYVDGPSKYSEINTNKRNPESVLIQNNDFYLPIISIQESKFTDIYENNFFKTTGDYRIEISTKTKSYETTYIHNNNFYNSSNFSITNCYNGKLTSNSCNLNLFDNKYYENDNNDGEFGTDENFKQSKNLALNDNAATELESLKSEKMGYIKIIRSPNKQVYWTGLDQTLTFDPTGMKIAIYKVTGEQIGIIENIYNEVSKKNEWVNTWSDTERRKICCK